MEAISTYLLPLAQIIWIDLLLSGDNAIVIALACRSLPEKQRRLGMVLGAGTAIILRIVFAVFVTFVLKVPFLKIVGGLLLLWIGIKLAVGEDDDGHAIEPTESLWRAVRTIAIADAVMSLDNVIAISAAAGGNIWLFVFGLVLSIPLIVFGSALLTAIIERFPVIIWAGAGLLGWIAGDMIISDGFLLEMLKGAWPESVHATEVSDGHGGRVVVTAASHVLRYGAALLGASLVIGIGWAMKKDSQPAS